MSPAVLLALAAGVLAAAGTVELAGALVERRATARPRPGAAVLRTLARLGRHVGAPAPPHDLATRIAAAGVRTTLADVMAVKAGGALAALLAAVPLASGLPGRLDVVGPLAAAGGAFVLPDWWLRRRTLRRGRTMAAELPDVLDLLRVAVSAGLTVPRALAEVGRRHPGLLAAELRRAAREMSLGVPRDEALAGLARRSPVDGIGALTAALERAERAGAPPAEALGALAREARSERARRTAEAAARAAPKIQLVVALVLVPSVFLLVAAALLPAMTG